MINNYGCHARKCNENILGLPVCNRAESLMPDGRNTRATLAEILNSMKNRKWLTAFMLIIVLINFSIKNFDFGNFEVQLHDTYFVFDVPTAVFIMTLIIYAVVCIYLLVRMNKILALIIAIVNPIGAIFMLVLFYMSCKP